MAASDYSVRSQGMMCPIGYLDAYTTRGETTLVIRDFKRVVSAEDDIRVGDAVLVNDEFMRVESVAMPNIVVARGCADTIPQSHAEGSKVWFISRGASSDNREYTAASTVGVKLLPFTMSGGAVPISGAPPLTVTFNWRFQRPYPPGNFMCNDEPWHMSSGEVNPTTDLVFTWAHRDRVVQADRLIGHNEASIGPEAGTTYIARVYDLDSNLVREVTGITGATWTYTYDMAQEDLPDQEGWIEVCSARDTLESWQFYEIDVWVSTPTVTTGRRTLESSVNERWTDANEYREIE